MARESAVLLAQRLRSLRLAHWPHRTITQRHLAEAFGGLSVPTISSWESPTNPKLPPLDRLAAYALFFATERSMEGKYPRLLASADLTPEESSRRDDLLDELTTLRNAADQDPALGPAASVLQASSLLRYPAGERIMIVCGPIPTTVGVDVHYTDPDHADYEEFYTFGDPRALMELYGYIREVNPLNEVDYKTSDTLTADDYTTHLALIGGVDWNTATRVLFEQVDIPVRQRRRLGTEEVGVFEVTDGKTSRAYQSKLAGDGRLLEDVAQFYRGPNPNNAKRTVTLFNGNYSRGTLGAVRSLIDPKFRDRNGEFVRTRLAEHGQLSLLTRAVVLNNQIVTPDWTKQGNRLHEWWGIEVERDRRAPGIRA